MANDDDETSQDRAPDSEEPVSLRDFELEPVSLHDIEKILAPGKAPPTLASTQPEVEAHEEDSGGEAETDLDELNERAPDSAISDIRKLAAARATAQRRDEEMEELLSLRASLLPDAPPAPLVPPDLADLAQAPAAEPPSRATAPSKEPAKAPARKKPTAPPQRAPQSGAAGAATPRAKPADEAPGAGKPDAGEPGSRWLLYLAGAAVMLGAGYWVGRGNTTAPAPAPTVTVVVTQEAPAPDPAPAAPETAEPAPEDPDEPFEIVSATGPWPTASFGAIASAAPSATAPETGAPASASAPSAAPSAVGSFDAAAANAAVGAAAGQAAGCKQSGDPSGQAPVEITFAPSGRVTTVNVVGPPFQGTSTGGCIARAFKSAKVPPFEGAPVTVRKTVRIP
jgi:hypothetical protein